MESLHLLSPSEKALDEAFPRTFRETNSNIRRTSLFERAASETRSRTTPFTWIKHRVQNQRSVSPQRHVISHLARSKCMLLRILTKLALLITFSFLLLSVWKSIFSPSYAHPPQRYLDLEERVNTLTTSGRGNINNQKVFIAANIIDEDLIRGSWGTNLLSLVDLLGKENVFVSIYENDSGNGTSEALRHLQHRLPCNSSVVTGDHVPLSGFPAIRMPNGEERVQRITYLAEIRNRLLRPLDPSFQDNTLPGFQTATNVKFDRILFLNDVYYSPLEAVQLLFSTNAGNGQAQYRAACALDFIQLFKMYDTFVVRDTDGYRAALQFFPWFTSRGTGTTRKDVLSLTDAVRVRSCWGGMAAFDANVFQPEQKLEPVPVSHDSAHNTSQLTLKFRSNGEPFWEAAECCLIFADMEEKFGGRSEHEESGVFINPFVRTAYSPTTWKWIPFLMRYERIFENYQHLIDFFKPPEWNPRRTHEPGQMVDEVVWVDSNSTSLKANPHYRNFAEMCQHGHFEVQHRAAPVGGFCGERRMFVMKKDLESANSNHSGKNWENLHVPWHVEVEKAH